MNIRIITPKRGGKVYKLLLQIGKWIVEKKRFIYQSPDYIVVGLSMAEYIEHFPMKSGELLEQLSYEEAIENNK